jgi:hypothetical protein
MKRSGEFEEPKIEKARKVYDEQPVEFKDKQRKDCADFLSHSMFSLLDLHNATRKLLEQDDVVKFIGVYYNSDSNSPPDPYEIALHACNLGAYKCLGVVLADHRASTQQALNKFRFDGLFGAFFDDMATVVLEDTCYTNKNRRLCLLIMATDLRCQDVLDRKMDELRKSTSERTGTKFGPCYHPQYQLLKMWTPNGFLH